MKETKNTTDTNKEDSTHGSEVKASPGIWRRMRMILICVLVMGCGITAAAYLSMTAPKANKKPPRRSAPLVQIKKVNPATHSVVVTAMGTVIPAREMVLRSQVSGEIVSIHPEFIEGGKLNAGDEILRIDPADYDLAVVRKESDVADAGYALKLEQGHQEVAKKEWELLNGDAPADPMDEELALRKPHLAKSQADLRAAEADLAQARIDLERTRIRAPFNAIIRNENIEPGSLVSTQDQLAELVCTDAYWIKVSIPVDRLQWITIPVDSEQAGSEVTVLYRNGCERTGRVIKLLSDLETDGRMARIVVSVKDPLGLKEPDTSLAPLLIGEYVRVEIVGRQLENAYRIARDKLRNNGELWIATPDNKLEIRPVETVWRDEKTVLLIHGLMPEDQLIISDLPTPVDGMPVQIETPISERNTVQIEIPISERNTVQIATPPSERNTVQIATPPSKRNTVQIETPPSKRKMTPSESKARGHQPVPGESDE